VENCVPFSSASPSFGLSAIGKAYLRVQGRWCYLYRAIDRDGNLIDTMVSATRDM
jgi:transposase-like protein